MADAVKSSGGETLLGGHRSLIAVLFCDIRGFTAFCEVAEPEETIEVLQTYHDEMGKLIDDHGAGFDHRSGDGTMVIFNDPFTCDNPARDTLRLWFGKFVMPWDWRRGQRLETANERNDGSCKVKGNISRNGTRVYHAPGGRWYDRTKIDPTKGERMFCSDIEAVDAGWRRSSQ